MAATAAAALATICLGANRNHLIVALIENKSRHTDVDHGVTAFISLGTTTRIPSPSLDHLDFSLRSTCTNKRPGICNLATVSSRAAWSSQHERVYGKVAIIGYCFSMLLGD